MIRFRSIPILLAIFATSALAAPTVWRTTVQQGDTDYVFDFAGSFPVDPTTGLTPPGTLTLGGIPLTTSEPSLSPNGDGPYFVGFAIPPAEKAGVYSLSVNGVSIGNLTVVPTTPINFVPLSPPAWGVDAAPLIQNILTATHGVLLNPGVYTFISTANVPSNSTIMGVSRDSVVIRRLPDPNTTDQFNRAFTSTGNNVTIGNLTLDATAAPGATLFHSNSVNANCNFPNVKLIQARGPYGTNTPGALVDGIETQNGSITPNAGTVYRNPHLKGVCDYDNECIASGNPIILNGDWDGTCRGIVARQLVGAFIADSYFHNIVRGSNANEVILFEDASGTVQKNDVFSHIFTRDCAGTAIQLTYAVQDCRFMFGNIDGGLGMWLTSNVTGCEFDDIELKHTRGLDCGGSSGNAFNRLAIVAPCNGKGNQACDLPQYYGVNYAVRNGDGDTFNGSTFNDMGGWTSGDPATRPSIQPSN